MAARAIGSRHRRWLYGLLLLAPLLLALLPFDASAQDASRDASWQQHMRTAGNAHRNGDSAGAERLLGGALDLAQGFADDDRRRGVTRLALATVLYEGDRYAEARAHLLRAVTIFEAALGPDHPTVATALNALALTHLREDANSEAEPLFDRALRIFEAAYGPDNDNVVQVLENLAGMLLIESRYRDAEPLYRRLIDVKERALGMSHADVGRLLESFSIVLRMTDRDAEADTAAARAQAILSPAPAD